MNELETYKAQLKEMIDALEERHSVCLIIADLQSDETAATDIDVGIHNVSMRKFANLLCIGLKEAMIEARMAPVIGAKYIAELHRAVTRAGADASAEVLKTMPEDEKIAELDAMLEDLLGSLKASSKGSDGDGHTEE